MHDKYEYLNGTDPCVCIGVGLIDSSSFGFIAIDKDTNEGDWLTKKISDSLEAKDNCPSNNRDVTLGMVSNSSSVKGGYYPPPPGFKANETRVLPEDTNCNSLELGGNKVLKPKRTNQALSSGESMLANATTLAEKEKAFKFLHEAAQNGDVHAFSRVAQMYEKGIGTKKDMQEAMKWHNALGYRASAAVRH